jgi:Fic family protein
MGDPDALFTIQAIMTQYDTSYQTARTDLLGLAKKGFLQKRKVGKEFCFIPIPLRK